MAKNLLNKMLSSEKFYLVTGLADGGLFGAQNYATSELGKGLIQMQGYSPYVDTALTAWSFLAYLASLYLIIDDKARERLAKWATKTRANTLDVVLE